MKIICSFHPSSSVLGSVKCRLGSGDLEYLVVAKLDRLEVFSLRSHGLQKECVLPVLGKICSVKTIPISSEDAESRIAIMLTHPEPELLLLSYNEEADGSSSLTVDKQIPLFERLPRIAEFFTDFLVHPSGELVVVSCYASKIKIINLSDGKYVSEFDAALPETNLISLTFLPIPEPCLAILFLDFQGRLQLCARDINIEGFELSAHPSILLKPTNIPDKVVPFPTDIKLHLIPVSPIEDAGEAFPGGIMVAGGRQVLLYELASEQTQENQRGKIRRAEARLKSTEPAQATKARDKEQEKGFKKRKPMYLVEWPWNEMTTWSGIDGDSVSPSKILASDKFGRLAMISLENLAEAGIILIPLGEVSPPTTLTYLTNGVIYVGSHLGDSQLVRITDTPSPVSDDSICHIPPDIKPISSGSLAASTSSKGKAKATDQMLVDGEDDNPTPNSKGRVLDFAGSYINVLEDFKNIAPIMDAIVVDIDSSGQVQLVTCSGGANTGSLNIVRNGSEYKEQAFVQGLSDVTGIWPVRTNYEDQNTAHLVVSTLAETHLFRINDSGHSVSLQREDCESSDFITNKPTLAFSNFHRKVEGKYVDSCLVVQVVSNAVSLLQWNTSTRMYTKEAEIPIASISSPVKKTEIVAADLNSSQVAIALSGGKICVYFIANNEIALRRLAEHQTLHEISAVSLMPVNTQLPFSKLVTVAYWETNVVEIFSMKDNTLYPTARSPALPSVVRSLLLFNFGSDSSSKGEDYHVFLLAGLGDGSIATMMWKNGGLRDLKLVSLGHAPVNLTPCEVDGKKAVFAAGNRSTLFSFDKNRLVNSPITLKEISTASRINTRSFTSSLVLATSSGLSVGFVRNLNKMHIRSVKFGLENPRKLTHSPLLHAFGVACTSIRPVRIGEYEALTSSFHLVDDVSLTRLAQFTCGHNEEISSVLAFTSNVQNEEHPFFCIGTLVYDEAEIEPSSGRLIVLTVAATNNGTAKEFKTVAAANVGGCVFALKSVGDKIVASVNSSISLWKFEGIDASSNSPPLYTLKKVAEWNHSYIISSLGALDDRVVAGDQISSVSLLSVENIKLVTKARDYGPLYPLAVELVDKSTIITSNDALNIVMFKLEQAARGGQSKLERIAVFHLGDMISKFFRGSLTSGEQTNKGDLNTEMVFFTSSGRIGIVVDIQNNALALHLSELQRNMSASLPTVGGASHTRYRAPKDTRGSTDAEGAAFGFIDGDFLEYFPGLTQDARQKIMDGKSAPEKLKMPEYDFLKILEQLQGLH